MKFYIISSLAFVFCILLVLPKTQPWFLRKPASTKMTVVFYLGLILVGFGILTNIIVDIFW
jgi:hypothetical protein